MPLTTEQVLALAPDASSASAGKKLADARHWKSPGRSDRALWGECQGSALYQVRVDLSDFVAKCSCPSRKFPCKHSIALLLLSTQSEQSFTSGAEPEWVTSWLDKRGAAAEIKEKKASQPAKPVDEQAQAKRLEQREDRVRAGLEALDLWLADLVRNGLATVEREPPSFWEARASRLVDAQAPGLASRIRRIGAVVGSTPDWPADVLEEIGRIALLTEAYRRIDQLSTPLQADVRQLIGWTLTQDEVIALNDTVRDSWFVLGMVTEEDERFRAQRSWLRGMASGRTALILQFAAGTGSFPELIVPGTWLDADLAFWPGAAPTRALIRERRASASTDHRAPLGFQSIEELLDHFSKLLGSQPWSDRTAGLLNEVVVRPGEPFQLIDRSGQALPLARGDHWMLASLSGGHPIDIAGEWNGRTISPLGAIADEQYIMLARS